MYDRKTPGNQSTEAIEIGLANFNKHIENINQKLRFQTWSKIYPIKLQQQNNWKQERFLDLTSQIITNEYANIEIMDER